MRPSFGTIPRSCGFASFVVSISHYQHLDFVAGLWFLSEEEVVEVETGQQERWGNNVDEGFTFM